MKLSTLLKISVENFCTEFNLKSSLFRKARTGQITKRTVSYYVANLEYLFKTNCQQILAASKLYEENPNLSEFFRKKFHEENGHDQWARSDLKGMNTDLLSTKRPVVLNEMLELCEFLDTSMKSSPYKYISYMYFAEYMTTILGPIWLSHLDQSLGIKDYQVTSLSKHIELDGDHASEVGNFLDLLELNTSIQIEISRFISDLGRHYNQFFNRLAELSDESGYTTDQRTISQTITPA